MNNTIEKGMRIGFLEVVCRNKEDERKGIYWLCKCHCPECSKSRNPKFVSIRQDKLKAGKTLSCGYNKELQTTKGCKNTNKFKLYKDYYICHTSKGEIFYFDKEDYDLVTSVSKSWNFNDGGYLIARDTRKESERYPSGAKKVVYLKDIILNKKIGERVEYVDKLQKYDNRKSNLKKISSKKECE